MTKIYHNQISAVDKFMIFNNICSLTNTHQAIVYRSPCTVNPPETSEYTNPPPYRARPVPSTPAHSQTNGPPW